MLWNGGEKWLKRKCMCAGRPPVCIRIIKLKPWNVNGESSIPANCALFAQTIMKRKRHLRLFKSH